AAACGSPARTGSAWTCAGTSRATQASASCATDSSAVWGCLSPQPQTAPLTWPRTAYSPEGYRLGTYRRLVTRVAGGFELEGGVGDVEVTVQACLQGVEHGRAPSIGQDQGIHDHVRG